MVAGAERSCLSSFGSPIAGGSCSHTAVTLRAAQEEAPLLCGTPVAHIAVLAFWKMMVHQSIPGADLWLPACSMDHSALGSIYIQNCL